MGTPGNAGSVLLIDDEEAFLNSLADGLRELTGDLTVLTAVDGEQALRVLESNRVDVVVTDLAMPRMDGFELMARLERRSPRIPTIVVTAINSSATQARLAPLAPFAVLDKPVDLDQVATVIRQALHRPHRPLGVLSILAGPLSALVALRLLWPWRRPEGIAGARTRPPAEEPPVQARRN